ncbi:hypothetical protein EVG20_g8036 [Dentipellis fragilis]|uniref:Uncharacterized protein n=1 Tax=Dentipellis fragilis TaxID=205917 RepID=A0A4Y9YCZ5_9AGAM|nr:hypothetical protein EVG20_g8036 [Dentipellis fragilis]
MFSKRYAILDTKEYDSKWGAITLPVVEEDPFLSAMDEAEGSKDQSLTLSSLKHSDLEVIFKKLDNFNNWPPESEKTVDQFYRLLDMGRAQSSKRSSDSLQASM